MKNNLKRLLAMFLAVMMVVGTFTIPVFAEDVAPEKPDPETCVHEWRFEKTVDPTCVTQGYDLEYCPICYEYRQINVTDKGDHKMVDSEAVDATCAAAGHSAGKVCSVCGALGEGVIEYPKRTDADCGPTCDTANGKHDVTSKDCIHTWKAHAEGNPCLDAVEVTYECTCCGIEIKTNTDGKGHTYKYFEDTLAEPECDIDGKIQRGCEFGCKDALHWVTIIAPGHKYDKVNPGKDTGKCSVECSVCGDVKVGSEVHEWDAEKHVAPDCVNTGKDVCKKCGYVLTIAANGHTYAKDRNGDRIRNEDSVDFDCSTETNGWDYFDCTECDYVDKVEVEFHHTLTQYTSNILPTCVFGGVATGRCDVCGNIAVEYSDPTGHQKGDAYVRFEGNCIDGGFKVYICTVQGCGAEIKDPVAPGTHTWRTIVAGEYPAKCGVNGWKEGSKECTVCGHIEGEVDPMPYDHEYVVFYTYGKGCVDDKVTYTHCKNSGCDYNCEIDVNDAKYTNDHDALVDDLEEEVTDGVLNKTVAKAEGKHVISAELEVIKASTCHETGWMGYKCERCDYEIKESPITNLDVDNHDYPDQQFLVNFRWTCRADGGEQLYSDIYCAACKNVYTVKTVVPAATGLDIAVGSYIQFNPENNTYTTFVLDPNVEYDTTFIERGVLKSITIYVDGVDKNAASPLASLAISADDVKIAEKDYVIAGVAHVWKYANTSATCGADGEIPGTCVFCGDTITVDDPASGKHTVTTWETVTPATCTKTGTKKGNCVDCGAEVTGTIDKDPHEFTKVVIEDKYQKTPASCTDKAVYWYACEVCGATDDAYTFEYGEMLAHTYDANVKCGEDCKHQNEVDCYYAEASTCIVGTKYYVSCSECGESSEGKGDDEATFEDAADLADHIPSAKKNNTATQPAQCAGYWYAQYDECTVCEIVLNWYGYVPQAEDHKLNKEKTDANYVEPTCIMLGYWKYDCEYCNKTIETEIDVNSQNACHKNVYGEDLTGNCKFEATNGDYTCATLGCGATILPDQHFWEADPEGNVYDCGVKDEKCVVCGIKRHNSENAKHTWVKDEDNSVDATFDTEGVYVEKCSAGCGATTEPKKVDKLPSLVFSLEIANPNGGDIVTGGKARLTIKFEAIDVDVTSVCLKLDVSKYLANVNKVENGALGGYAEAFAKNNIVTVWADANKEQKFVNLDGEGILCVLEFDVVYDGDFNADGIIDNELVEASINFVEPVVDDPKTEDVVETDPQIMVLDPNNERVTFDVKTNNDVKFDLNQIADANDDAIVNSQDALIIRQAIETRIAGTEVFEYDSVLDIDKNGVIDVNDYILIMQYIIGRLDYADLVKAKVDAE